MCARRKDTGHHIVLQRNIKAMARVSNHPPSKGLAESATTVEKQDIRKMTPGNAAK